jgi:hypothetical protein
MSKRVGPITLDGETADRVTLLTLKEYRSYLKKELADWKKNNWLHPEDVSGNTQVIQALNLVIKQYE